MGRWQNTPTGLQRAVLLAARNIDPASELSAHSTHRQPGCSPNAGISCCSRTETDFRLSLVIGWHAVVVLVSVHTWRRPQRWSWET
jgi:hypothetical protein